MTRFEITKDILFRKLYIFWLIFGAALCASGIFWVDWHGLAGMCIIYVVFDLVGYEVTQAIVRPFTFAWWPRLENGNFTWLESEYLDQSFRIMLGMFKVLMTAFGFFTFGWEAATGFWFLWWFGILDSLYYLIGQYNFFHEIEFHWLKFTPFGLLQIKLTPSMVFAQDILGIGMVILTWKAF